MSIGSIVIIVLLLWYVIKKRNEFNTLHKAVKTQGSNIHVAMAKRKENLHHAMNTASIACGAEVKGLATLTAKDQLNQLTFLGQRYPTLSSSSSYIGVLKEVRELTDEIAATRTLLNSNINAYNEAISTFPGLLIAKILGYKPEKLINDDAYEQVLTVDSSDFDYSQFR